MSTLAALKKEAAARGVVLPSAPTLAKYGWDLRGWLTMLAEQGWACGVCGKPSGNGKYVTDHEHVRGWVKMPAERRRLYVRGLTCWWDNRYLLARNVTVATAEKVLAYLKRYAARRPK